jgi:hypothetical protein
MQKASRSGQRAHTYEVQHDWGELPRNITYGNVHGVVEDSQGRIYVRGARISKAGLTGCISAKRAVVVKATLDGEEVLSLGYRL